MSTKYLLPCACGENLMVDSGESGLSLPCTCGAQLTVPTMRGLAKLDKVEVEEDQPAQAWGARQRGIIIGAVLLVIGLAIGLTGTFLPKPTVREVLRHPSDGVIDPLLERDTPDAVYVAWVYIQSAGLNAAPPDSIEKLYDRPRRNQTWWAISGYSIAAIGLIMVAMAVLLPKPQRVEGAPRPRPEKLKA